MLELLGRGGMGYVFRAEHVKLGREVALKLLRSDYARRRDAVARFFQEARTVNRVRHRNIVDVTDFVELDDGTTFIIMEFLRGQSLGRWARTGVSLPHALAVLVQICDGLDAAHQVGVVHRDLKPDNVIVVPTSDGAELVKLLDFGVAKLLNRDDEDVGFATAAGSVIGTPAYMSPEQAGGMAIDARSDIYSLGAIMYELFCGQPMFRGRSFGEYVRKHLTEVPLSPRSTPNGAQLDPRLELLIMKSLEKDPDMRFGDIVELREALLNMLGSMDTHPPNLAALATHGLRALPSVLPAMASPRGATRIAPPRLAGSQVQPVRPHAQVAPPLPPTIVQPATPWWVWTAGGAIAIAIGVVTAVWYAERTEDTPPAAPVQAVTATAPVAEPIEQPPPRPRSHAVELRFDSLPTAGVYADGHAAELCRTPCVHNIDLKDGGATDQRTFLVRSRGYRDAKIVVDLSGAQREFKVTLDQLGPDRPARTGRKGGKGRTKPQADGPATSPRSTASPSEDQPDAAVVEPRHDPAPVIEPVDRPTKEPRKPPTKSPIDPSDTLDPFHRDHR